MSSSVKETKVEFLQKERNDHPDQPDSVGLPSRYSLFLWQHWMQDILDFQEFFYYATVAKRKKPGWSTPNKIASELNCFSVRKFESSNEKQIPTLILPPFAGHYSTIADYAKEQSLVKHLNDFGINHTYSLDYKSATQEMKFYDIDQYLMELNIAVNDLGDHVNLIGLCQGGWFAAIFAARFPQKVNTLVLAGSPIDTKACSGFLDKIVENAPDRFWHNVVAAGGGLMDGKMMLNGFKSMNPSQHYWQKYMDLYQGVKGKRNDESYLDRYENFEVWYENTLKLPGKWYKQVIKELFKENKFIKGEFKALGQIAHPKNITCPTYLLGGKKDDITLPEQVFDAELYFGTPKENVEKGLADAGHIGLFMGRKVLSENWKNIANWMLKYS